MEILIREAPESDLAAITQLWNEMMAFHKDAMPFPLVEIEHFFISYNSVKGNEFKPIHHAGPKRALELLQTRQKLHKKSLTPPKQKKH